MNWLALFRGINVGGKNILPMKALAEIFVSAGAENVSTFIQSGNVLFSAQESSVSEIEDRVAAEVRAVFGIDSPIVFRHAAQMLAVSRSNPFEDAEKDALFVMFLSGVPSKAAVASLDPNRSPGDEFRVVGAEIFLNLRTGAAKTKLTNAYFDSKLRVVSTARNWRTVNRLSELLSERVDRN